MQRVLDLMADFSEYPFQFDTDAVHAFFASCQQESQTIVVTGQEDTVFSLDTAILDCGVMEPFDAENWIKVSCPNIQTIFHIENLKISSNLQILNHEDQFFFENCFPGYLKQLFHFENFQKAKDQFSEKNIQVIEKAFLLNHGHDHIYGHFLTEIFPKITIVDMAYRMGFRFPVVIGNQTPEYCEKLFRIVLPDIEIIRIPAGGLEIKQCFLPSHPPLYLMNKAQMHAFDRAVAANCGHQNERLRLLVCRSQIQNSYRQIENWGEIEALAKNYGFTIFTPGDHSLEEQIDHFARADIIVGEYSSALHNSLFSGPAKVISLNWINHVQQAICYSRRQPLTIIMPEDGTAILAPTNAYSEPVPYRVKLSSLKNALDHAIRNN